MASSRILILSNTRPSRAWRFARRLTRELPGTEICGIVQVPIETLPQAQQSIIAQHDPAATLHNRIWAAFADAVLRCVHGYPRAQNAESLSSVKAIADECDRAGVQLLRVKSPGDQTIPAFIAGRNPDLVIALGNFSALQNVSFIPENGWLTCRESGVLRAGETISIEHSQMRPGPASVLARITLPRQPHDGPLGVTLKSDLVMDDMLIQAAAGLRAGGPRFAAAELAAWTDRILAPYLAQLSSTEPKSPDASPKRRWLRSVWSLCVETLFLCSPWIVSRNWIRRWNRRYPVLILTHHLVSDRPHRMGISTEACWKQFQFLRRHYRIVSLAEASRILDSSRSSSPAVAITFDDGYADNFISLRAVADELEIPVALFITTQPVNLHTEFQHDVSRGNHGAFPMTWDQIRYWNRRGAEFGSHTRTHIRCGNADRTVLRDEIFGSAHDLELQLGAAPEFFAFPYGNRENLPPEALKIGLSAYRHVLSSYGGENFPGDPAGNAHLLRKRAFPEPWELELELQSVFDFVESIKRVLHLETGELSPARIARNTNLETAIAEGTFSLEKNAAPFAAESTIPGPPMMKQ